MGKGESPGHGLWSQEGGDEIPERGHDLHGSWTHLALPFTIADATGLPEQSEGPTETAMVQLDNGDLMAVFRIGSGREMNLRRSYSKDAGRTWSQAEAIPPYSVEPSLLRTKNGTLALSTGRPGIGLWLSKDPMGKTWQEVDIIQHHNRWHRTQPTGSPSTSRGDGKPARTPRWSRCAQ